MDQLEKRWLLDGPIGKELEQFGHVSHRLNNAQKSQMIPTAIVVSQEVGNTLKLMLSLK